MIELRPPEVKSPKVEIEVRARIRVLHKVIEELLKAFYPDASIETIKKGILERQYFEKIYIYFLNKADNKVGEVIIKIDWEKHYIATSTEKGDTFNIDTNKSINEQLSELFPKIIEHMKKMKQHLGVQKTDVWYGWRNDIWQDKEKLKEARLYCGFKESNNRKEPQWETLDREKVRFKITPEKLNELGLEITHFK